VDDKQLIERALSIQAFAATEGLRITADAAVLAASNLGGAPAAAVAAQTGPNGKKGK
jgi:hypothetical protein